MAEHTPRDDAAAGVAVPAAADAPGAAPLAIKSQPSKQSMSSAGEIDAAPGNHHANEAFVLAMQPSLKVLDSSTRW